MTCVVTVSLPDDLAMKVEALRPRDVPRSRFFARLLMEGVRNYSIAEARSKTRQRLDEAIGKERDGE